MKKLNITPGTVFNRLTALSANGKDKHGNTLWLFLCECGTQTTKPASWVSLGRLKSCGCLLGERQSIKRNPETGAFLTSEEHVNMTDEMRAAKEVWRVHYKDGCSFEDFLRLSQEPCHYCGTIELTNYRTWGSEVFRYNSLDRKDSSLHHTLDNIVPACKRCNEAKLDTSYQEFIDWIHRAHNHLTLLSGCD